ncbi:MAG TPA: protein translocase subunit SecD, partial [Nocardioides sp.]|nr:protein translocase subunit SecD [Nocardioides sp.]
LGVAEPNITRQGNTIVVELPGVKNAATALAEIGQTAQLQFRAVQTDPSSQQALIFSGPGPAPAPTTTLAPGTPTTTAVPAVGPATTAVPAVGPATTAGALGASPRVATAGEAPLSPHEQTATTAAPAPTAAPAAPATTVAPASPTTTAAPNAASGPAITQPDASGQVPDNQTVVLPQYDTKNPTQIVARYVLGPVLLKGNIISTAAAQIDQTTGQWYVLVNFTNSGGQQFDNVIGKGYVNHQVAIVLDNKVESAPVIQQTTFNGSAQITGNFSHSQASALALVLKYGALPVKLVQADVQTVSASLGKSSLHAGLVAGLIGLALVLLYMIFYYRALGIVVMMGLSISAALLYSIVTYLGHSSLHQALSLSGVVGVIVSVGVTVDSYIVYFERLKDDIRAGKSIRTSVDRSFARAWRTIWTADLVSIIAALLLYWLTVGAVRGFAFFLGLSTALDLVVSYTFTRPMVFLLGRNRTFTEARFLGVARGLAAAPAGGAA